jgi:diacylglycerol kinase family enzyme
VTIKKGEAWGSAAPLPEDGVVVHSDAEAAEALEDARRLGRPLPVLGLLGGDLCRTLGGTGDRARLTSAEAMTFPVDLGEVLVDGRIHLFVAHVTAGHRLRFAAMNAQWLGAWNLGPRGHPNDGRLDVYEGALSLLDWWQVRRRLPHGAHLPHPRIEERHVPAVQVAFPKALPVHLDGRRLGDAHNLSVRVAPDALRVVV